MLDRRTKFNLSVFDQTVLVQSHCRLVDSATRNTASNLLALLPSVVPFVLLVFGEGFALEHSPNHICLINEIVIITITINN